MQLTKKQIQYIDYRLEEEGVKFWDVRLEMLDHVVSILETKLQPKTTDYQFKELVLDAFETLGYKENFNGGGFEAVFLSRCKGYNKIYNKSLLHIYKHLFTNLKFIAVLITFFSFLYVFSQNRAVIKGTFFVFLAVFILSIVGFALKYKVFKSLQLNRAILVVGLPISLLNIAIYWPKVFLGYDKLSTPYLAFLLGVITPLFSIGLWSCFKAFKHTNSTYKKLIE